MSTFARTRTIDFISDLGDLINSEDLKLVEINGGSHEFYVVVDSGIQVHSQTQGEMIRVYSPDGRDHNTGGFYMSMDHDLDKVMFLASTLEYGELCALVSHWKEVKNFISLISGD